MQHAQNDTDHYTVSLPVIVKFLIGASSVPGTELRSYDRLGVGGG
jgi:hypothetical protein